MFQKILFVSALITTPAFACQPPPANYFSTGSVRAILDSAAVWEKLGNQEMTSIEIGEHRTFTVVTRTCALGGTIEAHQTGGPCGGPFKFTAIPAQSAVCLPAQ